MAAPSANIVLRTPAGTFVVIRPIDHASQNDLSVVSIGATRPVCAGCQAIIPDDTSIATPLK